MHATSEDRLSHRVVDYATLDGDVGDLCPPCCFVALRSDSVPYAEIQSVASRLEGMAWTDKPSF
jgi:hypothetical protein